MSIGNKKQISHSHFFHLDRNRAYITAIIDQKPRYCLSNAINVDEEIPVETLFFTIYISMIH